MIYCKENPYHDERVIDRRSEVSEKCPGTLAGKVHSWVGKERKEMRTQGLCEECRRRRRMEIEIEIEMNGESEDGDYGKEDKGGGDGESGEGGKDGEDASGGTIRMSRVVITL